VIPDPKLPFVDERVPAVIFPVTEGVTPELGFQVALADCAFVCCTNANKHMKINSVDICFKKGNKAFILGAFILKNYSRVWIFLLGDLDLIYYEVLSGGIG
jgi:hypothetical protein